MAARIGFIGVGGISANHLFNLSGIKDAEVVALADLTKEQVEATRERVHARIDKARQSGDQTERRRLDAVAYDDYRAMLRNEKLDAVYICLPPFVHGAVEEAVIEAGVPMLVEKPVGLDLETPAKILKALKKKGLWAASGYQTRYAPYIAKAKELLAGRTIGMAVVMRFGGTPKTPWYRFQAKSGGQLVEMATHQVDILRYLVGEVETVYAAAATRINNKVQPDYDVFDVNCMTLKFKGGEVANFANSMISDYGSPLEARGVHIFCDGMTLSITNGLKVLTPQGSEEFPGDDPMRHEDATFVRAVVEGRPDLIVSDYASGVRTLAVTLAGERSARSGQPIHMSEFLDESIFA